MNKLQLKFCALAFVTDIDAWMQHCGACCFRPICKQITPQLSSFPFLQLHNHHNQLLLTAYSTTKESLETTTLKTAGKTEQPE